MFTVVGFKKITAKKDGIEYVEVHLLSDDRFVEGQRCDTVFVRADQIDNIAALVPGCVCDVYFGRYARPGQLSVDHIVIH